MDMVHNFFSCKLLKPLKEIHHQINSGCFFKLSDVNPGPFDEFINSVLQAVSVDKQTFCCKRGIQVASHIRFDGQGCLGIRQRLSYGVRKRRSMNPLGFCRQKRRETLAKRGDVSDVTRFQHIMKHLFFKADFALKRSVDWMKLAAEKHRVCHEIACQCMRKLGQLFFGEKRRRIFVDDDSFVPVVPYHKRVFKKAADRFFDRLSFFRYMLHFKKCPCIS